MKEYPNFHLYGALDLEDFTCVVFSHLEFQKVPEIFGLRDFSPIILQEFFPSFVPILVANVGCKYFMKEYMGSPTYAISTNLSTFPLTRFFAVLHWYYYCS